MHIIKRSLHIALFSVCALAVGCEGFDDLDADPTLEASLATTSRDGDVSPYLECRDPSLTSEDPDAEPYLVCHIPQGICHCIGEKSCTKLKDRCGETGGTWRDDPDDDGVPEGSCQW